MNLLLHSVHWVDHQPQMIQLGFTLYTKNVIIASEYTSAKPLITPPL